MISQIQGLQSIAAPPSQLASKGADGSSFQQMLVDSLKQVNTMQQEADRAVESFATGGDVNPAEVLVAVQKADLAFRMMMQVRNKLVQAYQEIKDIRV
jgi:flagellar hook-basal body complex protein FliE